MISFFFKQILYGIPHRIKKFHTGSAPGPGNNAYGPPYHVEDLSVAAISWSGESKLIPSGDFQ